MNFSCGFVWGCCIEEWRGSLLRRGDKARKILKELGKKLKDSLLKGSLDKRVRIDFAGSFACPHPTPHTPHPLPLFPHFHRKTQHPHHPPEPDPKPLPQDTNRNSYPFAKTTQGKNYPLVSADQRVWANFGAFFVDNFGTK